MTNIHHINCVLIESPFGSAIGHCLLLEENNELALIDTGIGLLETKEPEKRLGKELIEITGFKFKEEITAVKQIENLGFNLNQVKSCICSHLDPDHIGGVADFPDATVHVSKEEYDSFKSGNPRYLTQQFSHNPKLKLYEKDDGEWFGLKARKVDLNFDADIFLIPLFGHTLGHCGIAIKQKEKWIFYVGDAYYLRAEINESNHPIDELATVRADDNTRRIESLNKIRVLVGKHQEIEYFGYHDPTELNLKNKSRPFNSGDNRGHAQRNL